MQSDTGSARNYIAQRLIILADQDDREAWLEARRGGLGGSDMSAICDENPHKSAIDVWNSIRGEPSADAFAEGDKLDRLEMGHVLEPHIVGMYAEGRWRPAGDRRLTVWRPPLVARRDREWQRGSCDGLGLDTGRGLYFPHHGAAPELVPPAIMTDDPEAWWSEIVECKTHGLYAGTAYDDAEASDDDVPVPADKLIQTAWYGSIWEVRRVALLALIDTHLRRFWTYQLAEELITDLLTIGEEWWRRHVLEGHTPDPDGSKRYRKHIRGIFAKTDGSTVRASPELEAVVRQLLEAREGKKEIEREAERLSQLVQLSMGPATTLLTRWGTITWNPTTGRVRLRDAIDALYPRLGMSPEAVEIHENSYRGEAGRTFRVNAKLAHAPKVTRGRGK